MQELGQDKRGPRDSPRTPAQEKEKKLAMEKLREISKKMSPVARVPPLPGGPMGASGSTDEGSGAQPQIPPISTPGQPQSEESRSPEDGKDDDDMKTMMKKMMGMIGGLSKDMQTVKSAVEEAGQKADKAVSIAERTEAKIVEVQKTAVSKTEVEVMINESVSNAVDLKFQEVTKKLQSSSTLMGAIQGAETLVMGGLQQNSLDGAKSWILKCLEGGPTPVDI
jgi:hypothetical protein